MAAERDDARHSQLIAVPAMLSSWSFRATA
jgi:hypothetical protein